jgi:aminoglycoside phosphotransferase (APT) family kinase protein
LAGVTIHRLPALPIPTTWDAAALDGLPGRCLVHLGALRTAGRWPRTDDLDCRLDALDQVASVRSRDAELAPFGFCHGELHRTSVHIGVSGLALLDFAKAYVGPGLLDLATWYGTRTPPDPAALRRLIHTYIAVGGHPDSLTDRGGLRSEAWGLGWHRVWAAHWYLHHAANGVLDPAADDRHASVVRRQLRTAAFLLQATGNRRLSQA